MEKNSDERVREEVFFVFFCMMHRLYRIVGGVLEGKVIKIGKEKVNRGGEEREILRE